MPVSYVRAIAALIAVFALVPIAQALPFYQITEIPRLPGGTFNSGNGINANGVVVGSSETASGSSSAYRFDSGVLTDLGDLGGGNGSTSSAIN